MIFTSKNLRFSFLIFSFFFENFFFSFFFLINIHFCEKIQQRCWNDDIYVKKLTIFIFRRKLWCQLIFFLDFFFFCNFHSRTFSSRTSFSFFFFSSRISFFFLNQYSCLRKNSTTTLMIFILRDLSFLSFIFIAWKAKIEIDSNTNDVKKKIENSKKNLRSKIIHSFSIRFVIRSNIFWKKSKIEM